MQLGFLSLQKKRFHAAQAISPHTAKETNQEDFRQAGAAWAKKPRQWRHAQRPGDPRLARLNFATPKVLD